MKLQVKVIVAKFSSQAEVEAFRENQMDTLFRTSLVFVSCQVIEKNEEFYVTFSFTTEREAAMFVLNTRPFDYLVNVAKTNNLSLTIGKKAKVPVTKEDVQKMIKNNQLDHLSEYELDDLRYKLADIFQNTIKARKYRKMLFEVKNIPFYKTAYKKCLCNKKELLYRIDLYANDLWNEAWEISYMFK
jgi:hypothetical protein